MRFRFDSIDFQMLLFIVSWVATMQLQLPSIEAGLLNSILGVPNECAHQGAVWQCKLSFACWLQGGRHAKGCGANKWLFSCCIADANAVTAATTTTSVSVSASDATSTGGMTTHNLNLNHNSLPAGVLREYAVKKRKKSVVGGAPPPSQTVLPKRVMLRRHNDDNELFWQPECGMPRTNANTLQKRIIGGRPAQFAEYPWQAHIRIAEYQCGGVLVASNFIATAAHCIQQARLQDISVYLGELDTQNLGHTQEPLPVEKHNVLQKIIHPRFKYRLTQPDRYDLALLKLAKPTGFSEHILPICLPLQPINLIGRKGLIAGWGKTEISLGHAGTNMLQVASVPIITAAECLHWHESKHIRVELFNEMFCAGHSDGHQDACLGDSGGPLIIKNHGHFILMGITSAGFGCGVDHQPGIYHNVQKTAKWMQEVILRNAP